ncbi:unnamed protein product [Mytilus coruscus]|uniref:Uncharacterized protein n=1 Tax=Mytilus coruscus TaxID=42192 RepID=A0A6J8A436_MYTCO|nr:unnamed protein product [Mytilus coruscus]
MEHDAESQTNDCMKLRNDQMVNLKIHGENDTSEAIILGMRERLQLIKSTDTTYKTVSQRNKIELSDFDLNDSKEAELDNWGTHNLYEEVDDNGQNCICTRWVYIMKEWEIELHSTAILVAKGYEEDCLDEIQKNSPTCEKQYRQLLCQLFQIKGGQSVQ